MGAAAGIRAGRAYVEVNAKDNFSKALQGISSKMKAFGSGAMMVGGAMAGIGTAITGPMLAAAEVFNVMGSNMNDMSARTGASVETLSALKYAAEQTGTSVGVLEKSLRNMQKNGLDTNKLGEVADYLVSINDPAKRTAEAMRLMGKNGTAMLPMLAGGSAGLEKFRKEADALGIIMSTDAANSADAFGDSLDQLKSQAKALVFQIGRPVAEALTTAFEYVKPIVAGVIAWAKSNQALIGTIFKIASGVAVAGVSIVGIGAAIFGLGAAIGSIMTIAGAISAVFAAAFSPFGLLILGAATAAIGFRDSLYGLIEPLRDVWKFAQETFGGIANAIKAGDIELAFKILSLSLQKAWNETTMKIQEKWIFMKEGILTVWTDGIAKIKSIWIEAYTFIAKGLAWVLAKLTGKDAELMMSFVAEDSGYKLNDVEKERQADLARLRQNTQDAYDEDLAALRAQGVEIDKNRKAALDKAKAEADAADAKRKGVTADKNAKAPDLSKKAKTKADTLDALEGMAAYKKFEENRSRIEEAQLAELKGIRAAVEDDEPDEIAEA